MRFLGTWKLQFQLLYLFLNSVMIFVPYFKVYTLIGYVSIRWCLMRPPHNCAHATCPALVENVLWLINAQGGFIGIGCFAWHAFSKYITFVHVSSDLLHLLESLFYLLTVQRILTKFVMTVPSAVIFSRLMSNIHLGGGFSLKIV